MDPLIKQWKEGKETVKPLERADEIIRKAKRKKKSVLDFHYGNIVVLSITLIVISVYFYFLTPFRETLSRIGVVLMLGGLLARIIIEVFSVIKSKKVQLMNDSSTATNDAISFYHFRKKIHGPVTICIIVLYVMGFFFLSPELSKYISRSGMVLINGSFVAGAVFLIWVIRKGIRKEISNLADLIEVKKGMSES
jgi:hypothetical protein